MPEIIYTQPQKDAINYRGRHLLILACAGSGKTEVISRRIAKLVQEGTPKAGIVAFTFTERAAGELKARIRQHLEQANPDDPSLGDMFVGTIHGYCLETLRKLDPMYRRYEVMDEARQAALVITRFNYFEDNPNTIGIDRLRHLSRRGGYWDTVRTFLTTLNVIHQKNLSVESLGDPVLVDTINRYRRAAYESPNYFFDFDYIVAKLIEHLRGNPKDLETVRNDLHYLVVDEYQDVDGRQEELITLLTDNGNRAKITVVGDDDQAIYGWRGAKISNILEFAKRYHDVKTIPLVDNFRSTLGIVEIANAAIGCIQPGKRIQKDMIARRKPKQEDVPLEEQPTEPGDIQVRTFASETEEAEWVARRVRELHGAVIEEKDGTKRGIDYADMAILLRSVRNGGHVFAEALRQLGIPAVVKGTGGLFDHPEVRLIYAAFCLLARAIYVIRTDTDIRRLGELETREEIRRLIGQCGDSLKHANAEQFLRWISSKKEELDRRNVQVEPAEWRLPRRIYPQDIFQDMLQALGAHRSDSPFDPQVLFNWGRLSGLITQFEAVHQWVTPSNLVSLCMFLSVWASENVDEGGLDEVFTPNAVQILTVHAAKGLEWPVVFVSRVSSGSFPSQRRHQGPATFISESLFDPKEYATGDDGERRLWYVALTRCRKFLNVTAPKRKGKKPTKFFDEISHDTVQRSGSIPQAPKDTPKRLAIDVLPTTFSDLNYFWRCEFEYQLRSVMGFSPGVAESYGYGQQIHNILAEIHKRSRDGETFDEAKIDALVEKRFHLRYTKDGEKYKPLSRLKDAAKAALRNYVRKFSGFGKLVLEPEKPFEFVDSDSEAMISGTIDLLEKVETTPDGGTRLLPVALVDFKTTRFKDREAYETARENVQRQLQLYAVGARHAFGMEAKQARAHFLSPKELTTEQRNLGISDVVEVDVSDSAQTAIRRTVHNTVRKIQNAITEQNFRKSGVEKKACGKCDFREICFGYMKYKEFDRESPRPGTYEQERESEIRQVLEDVDAGPQTK
jgi:DNA helicase-2/ATP-dependent DNA helicase PcrA